MIISSVSEICLTNYYYFTNILHSDLIDLSIISKNPIEPKDFNKVLLKYCPEINTDDVVYLSERLLGKDCLLKMGVK